jgi:ABC-type lipoprotein release transport system permease subunit
MSPVKHLRQHATLFGALLGVVALVSGLSVGVAGYLAQAADDGVRSGLAERSGAELALRASLQLAEDAELQDREVRAAIAQSFLIDGHAIPMTVDRTVEGKADLARLVDGVPDTLHRALVISVSDIEERASIVDGSWASGIDEATLQADAAARLDIVVGDSILLGDSEFVMTGTWRVTDHLDPRWLGDTIVTDGYKDPDVGPVVIDEAAWPRLENTDPRARWTLVPEAQQLSAGDLGPIVAAWNSINAAWRGDISSDLVTLEKQGRFKRTALELGTRVDALRAVQPVALLLLAAIALVTLAELGRLLTTTRSNEIALLWSRGASALDVARTTAAETAVTAGIGAILGTGAALGVLAWRDDGLDAAVTDAGNALWIAPLAVTIAAVVVIAGSAFRSARRQTVRDPGDASGRARRLAGPGLVILVTAAAALAVWQLWLYGSPLTPSRAGGTQVDPVAVVAPALALVAIVLIGLALFPRVASLDERSSRRAGVARTLASRTVSRRLQLVAAPIVVVAVACANLVLAAGYATTWSDSFAQATELRAGAPVHVTTGSPGFSSDVIDRVTALPGVDGAAPLHVETLQLGNETGSILGVAPAALAELATTASGSFDREKLAGQIAMDIAGPDLPVGTTRVELDTFLTKFSLTPTVTFYISDALGVMRELELEGSDGAPPDDKGTRPVTYAADVPDALLAAPGPWRILAIDVVAARDAVVGQDFASFEMLALTAISGSTRTTLQSDAYWIPETPQLAFSPPNSNFSGQGFSIFSDTLLVRLTPSFDGSPADRVNPPIVISQQLAERFGVELGGKVSFFLEDSFERLDAEVVAIVPAIPGAPLETALLIDIGVVQHLGLRVTEVQNQPDDLWIQTSDEAAAAAALRPELPANSTIETSTDPSGRLVLGSASVALWMAAAGCGLLAGVTVGAVVGAQLRSRRLDIAVLRALGLDSRMQAAIRRRELLIVLGYGAVLGLIAGAAVTALTVRQLARAAVPNPYDTVATPLGVDVLGLAAGLGALVVVLAVIVAVYSIRVARLARSAATTEDAP